MLIKRYYIHVYRYQSKLQLYTSTLNIDFIMILLQNAFSLSVIRIMQPSKCF